VRWWQSYRWRRWWWRLYKKHTRLQIKGARLSCTVCKSYILIAMWYMKRTYFSKKVGKVCADEQQEWSSIKQKEAARYIIYVGKVCADEQQEWSSIKQKEAARYIIYVGGKVCADEQHEWSSIKQKVGGMRTGTYLVVMMMCCTTLRCDVSLCCPLHCCVTLLRCPLRCSAVMAELLMAAAVMEAI
jgi:hypothetical protein